MRYITGKVLKAFKIIFAFFNWEEVLYLINFDRWSLYVMYVVMCLFVLNLNVMMV